MGRYDAFPVPNMDGATLFRMAPWPCKRRSRVHAEFTVSPDIPKPADELTQEEIDLLKQVLPHIEFIKEDDGAGGTTKTIRFTGVNIEVEGGTITEL